MQISITIPTLIVKSWKDWQKILKNTPGVIEDEYGTQYSVEEFEALIARLAPGRIGSNGAVLKSHYAELVRNKLMDSSVSEQDWLDEEGFSFSATHFS